MARLAIARISLELLQEMMTEGWKVDGLECTRGLPEGAEFMYFERRGGARYGDLGMVFQHDSFDDVEPGGFIPELWPEFMRYYAAKVDDDE